MAKTFKGIDISTWNGAPDFEKVKAAGYDFVIIKAGGSDCRFYQDSKFVRNYEAARAAGLHVGAYYFVGLMFYGEQSGIYDAQRFIRILNGRQFDYPVFVDIETTSTHMKKEATTAAAAFCRTMEQAGYFVGIYASDLYGFRSRLIHKDLTAWAHWVADYTGDTDECKDYQIRQISSRGVVPGVQNYVDLDISRVDYPKIMKEKGLNNFPKPKGGKKK